MDEPWTLEDSLSSVCADLLSERRFESFVRRLFASPPGAWQRVADCCSGMPELPRHAAEVFANHAAALVVTHLPWPEPDSAGYAMVLFVHPGELWSTIAAYNRRRLEGSRQGEPDIAPNRRPPEKARGVRSSGGRGRRTIRFGEGGVSVWKRAMGLGLLAVVASAAGLGAYLAGCTTTEAVLVAILVALLGRPGPSSHRPSWRVAASEPSPAAEPHVAPDRPRVPVRVTPSFPDGGGR